MPGSRRLAALATALAGALALAGCAAAAPSSEGDLGGLVGSWHCVAQGIEDGSVGFAIRKDGTGALEDAGQIIPFVVKRTSTGFTINGTNYLPASAAKVTVPLPIPDTGTIHGKVTTKDGSYNATVILKRTAIAGITFTASGKPTWVCDIAPGYIPGF